MLYLGQLCEPCLANSQCKISFTFSIETQESTQLIWESEGKQQAACYTIENKCYIYPSLDTNLLFTMYSDIENITTELIIYNTKRISNTLTPEKTWRLLSYDQNHDSPLNYSCNFRIYCKYRVNILKL